MNSQLETHDSQLPTLPLVHRELHPEASLPLDAEGAPPYTLDFRSSDCTVDRYQEVISVSGWKLENYRKNPVVQNAHSYGSLADTIGKSIITEVRSLSSSSSNSCSLSSSSEERAGERSRSAAAPPSTLNSPTLNSPYLFQRIQFAVNENPVAKVAYGLYKGGFLSAVSVGFIPLRWENGTKEAGYRRKYLEQELLEVSAVSIPANPNAVALALKAGAIEKADLREIFHLLRHFCAEELALPSAVEDAQLGPLLKQLKEIRAILKRA